MTTTMTRSPWLLTAAVLMTAAGCSSLKGGKCTSCEQGAVYPPVGCYDAQQPSMTPPPAMPAPMPIPVPPATEPGVPPAPPPPLSARMPAALQNIRYSTGEFFHNANNNVRAMSTR